MQNGERWDNKKADKKYKAKNIATQMPFFTA